MIETQYFGLAPIPEVERMWAAFAARGLLVQSSALHLQTVTNERSVTGIVVLVEGANYACEVRSLAVAGEKEGAATSLRSLERRALLLALHWLLQRRTGHALPWGVLFGVRPVKVLHAWWRLRRAQAGELAASERDAALRMLTGDYAIRADRAALLYDVATSVRRVLPDWQQLGREVSVYVGIPFCPTRCSYCTFPAYSMAEKAHYAADFLAALEREIGAVGEALTVSKCNVTTVYVGGGTPTSLCAEELERLLTALVRHLPGGGSWREFSVEAGRADTLTPDRVRVMKEAGVSRVSVNPQTFHESTLQLVGRGHSAALIDKRFALVREAGFSNINMDLIMGLPGERLQNVRDSLARTLALKPDSVTVHTLSYKRGAAVKGDASVPSFIEVEAMLDDAERELREHGYLPYYLYRQKDILADRENVGYALVSKEGLYNIAIIEEWQSIVALGGGGASKWRDPVTGVITRSANARDPAAYVAHIDRIIADKRLRIHDLAKQCGLT